MKKLFAVICMVALILGCNDNDEGSINPPADLQIDAMTEEAIDLSWEDRSDNETGFEIERAIEGEDFRILNKTDADVESFRDEDITPGGVYAYRVRAVNSDRQSAYSNVVSTDVNVDSASLPETPENLQASDVGAMSLTITWLDRSDNESGFEIDRSLNDDFTEADTFNADVNETRFEDDQLTPETLYYYRVRAVNQVGASSWCQPLTVETTPVPATPPDAPSDLKAEAVSANRIEVTWTDNSDDEDGFTLMGSINGTTFETLHTTDGNVQTFTHDGLSPRTTYYYKVSAFNTAGASDETPVAEARTHQEPVAPPAPPENLTYSELTSRSVRLAWTDMSDDETGFRLERSLSNDFSLVETVTLDLNVTTYQDINLLPSTDYCYRLIAFNASGDSDYSDTLELRTPEEVVDLTAPSSLGLQGATASSIQMRWQDNSEGEDGFTVEYSTDGQTFTPAGKTKAGVTTYTHTGLDPGTTYHYRVNAFKDNQTSDFSNTLEARTDSQTPPDNLYIADYTIAKESVLRRIPQWAINAAKQNLKIMYCGTSHSQQVMEGMRGLMQYKEGDDTLFNFTYNGTATEGALNMHYRPGPVYSAAQDLSHDSTDADGHTEYFKQTEAYLDDNQDCNVVMWSWCGIAGHDMDIYLTNFSELIDMYGAGGSKRRTAQDAVRFVFMTGWASGESARENHDTIVNFCKTNGYFCLDYWSQDTYNYGDDSFKPTENGNDNAQHLAWVNDPDNELGSDWFQCRNWASGNVTLPAHANQHLTGNRRAYAAWWIWARLAGWDGTLE
jgi:fibronectin type 3 domain-containing protein